VTADGASDILDQLDRAAGTGAKEMGRLHSDNDKSFKGEVVKMCREKGIWRTHTVGYDANANARVEVRQGQATRMFRSMLSTAAGIHGDYKAVWGEAYRHVQNVLNNSVRTGGVAPVVKIREGGTPVKPIDMQQEFHVFGCEVKYFVPKEKRGAVDPKHEMTSAKGIWVGRDKTVPGGHRVIPVGWDESKRMWNLGRTIVIDTFTVDEEAFPLRQIARRKTGTPQQFAEFVDRFNPDGVDAVTYEVEKIMEHRYVEGEKEYRVKWKGWGKRDTTWEPRENLEMFGAKETLLEYEEREKDQFIVKYMIGVVEEKEKARQDVLLAVRQLRRRHTNMAKHTDDEWVKAYSAEYDTVSGQRLIELHGEERLRALREERPISMRMNPEPKKDGRCKMRWLVMGNLELKTTSGSKTDAPVISQAGIRTMVAMDEAEQDPEDTETIGVSDVSTAYIQGDKYGPEDGERFVKYKPYKGAEWRVYLMLGPVYGQRDAPMRWNATISKWLEGEGFQRGSNEKCFYLHPETRVKVGLLVDDVLAKGRRSRLEAFFKRLGERFKLKGVEYIEIGESVMYGGYNITHRKTNGVRWYDLDQCADVKQFLSEHDVQGVMGVECPMPSREILTGDTTPVSPAEHKWYRSVVGTMNWYAVATRWDIAHAMSRLGGYMHAPTRGAIKAAKRVMQYLKATEDFKISCVVGAGNVWERYVDSDHAGDREYTPQGGEDHNGTRSHTGVVITLNGMPVVWRSNKQPVTAVSSAVAEIYALAEAVRDSKLAAYRMEELGREMVWPLEIQVDNAAGVSFQKATCPDTRLKGTFDLRAWWVKELQDQTKVLAVKVGTRDNVADLLTKCHSEKEFKRIRDIVRSRGQQLASRFIQGGTVTI
jgi:hypothetical protein